MRRRALSPAAATAVSAVLLTACGGSRPASARHTGTRASARAPTAATDRVPPCHAAPVVHGAPPEWTSAAWTDSSPGFTTPYALASDDSAAAFFFARTLRAGHPTEPTNKVLWVVRFPRDGNPLTITSRLGTDPSQVVRASWPADSSPGEIYPSDLDLPKPGCWHVDVRWGAHRATLDVAVVPG